MKIYIELVFILNVLLDYMILYGTKRLLNRDCYNYRIIISSIIGGFSIIFLYIKVSSFILLFFKIIISIIMNLIAFGRKEVFKNTFYFYLISIILGGTLYLINIKTSFYENIIYLIFMFICILIIFIKEYKKYKFNIQDSYEVIVDVLNHTYKFKGFIDTGNSLKSPISNKGVILINEDINTSMSYFIPYKALNYEGVLKIIKPDKIIINNKEIKSCLIGISKCEININGFNCILPNRLKEEL